MAKQIKKYSKIALVIALTITMSVLYLGSPQIKAGSLSDKEVRLDDSRISDVGFYGASTTASYDFLATQSAANNISCIKVYFCTSAASPSWDGTDCTGPTGINFGIASTTRSGAWNGLTYANWSIIASTTNSITASTTVPEQLGTDGSWVFGDIYNPSATGTYYTWIYTFNDSDCTSLSSGGVVDSGIAAFAVFQGVTVTATIVESLNVTVNASSCNELITGTGNSTTSSATTSIGFGNITTETFYDSCQRIDIGTNAASGYVARIHKTQPLTAAGPVVIDDGDCDGGCGTTTAQVWQTKENNGFGYCMRDRTSYQHGAVVADSDWASSSHSCGVAAGSQYFKIIPNGTSSAEAIMQSNSATSTNQAFIGYRLSADSSQPAGVYTTEVIYTVTPKF